MRLWHTDLISVLPRQQLLGQWRELNSIFVKQDKHILINFVYDYSKNDLYSYSLMIMVEMLKRGYKVNTSNFYKYFNTDEVTYNTQPFIDKMRNRYLVQCYYNLQEKFDCGGITEEEWEQIKKQIGGKI